MNNVLQFKKKRDIIELSRAETKVWAILDSTIESASNLAEIYDVSTQTVRNIKLLKTSRAKKVHDLMVAHGINPKTWDAADRFTPEQVAEIRASAETSMKLGKRFNCSPSTIRMIKTGKTYV